MTERFFVKAPDGVSIAVEASGSPSKPPIVLLHGIAQSSRVWRTVLKGPLAASHWVVAVDMRGHGNSSAPDGSEAYASGDRLGGDLHAVLSTLELARPLVVAWSYGGVMLGELLRHHGGGALGGALFMAAAVRVGKPARALFGPGMMDHARALMSEDAATYEAGARQFMAGCAASDGYEAVVEDGVRAMLHVPGHVRRALLTRSEDYSPEIAAWTGPMATLHGMDDRVVLPQMSDEIEALRPGIAGTRLPGVGHLPWVEAPEAFVNVVEELAARIR